MRAPGEMRSQQLCDWAARCRAYVEDGGAIDSVHPEALAGLELDGAMVWPRMLGDEFEALQPADDCSSSEIGRRMGSGATGP